MKICTRCVMDTTDSKIFFDSNGVCDHCLTFDTKVKPNWHTGERGERELHKLVEQVKELVREKILIASLE